jgi:hypothetical protein
LTDIAAAQPEAVEPWRNDPHSTGGGEVARYIGPLGLSRVSKAVLISAVPPHMVRTTDNPEGAPMEVFDGRTGLVTDRPEFFKVLAVSFFGYNWPNEGLTGSNRLLLAARHDGKRQKRI